ncbi:hypothetical protein [Enterococcus pallens]|uniref:DUF5105 domain-containing protein n=1 Tax=Enterococcus pallens ATCC BAA-351 TaxID=1158607 RepID=R2SUM7_9ENTE|nr:hypothetical protein [Enterococcus pallens]EOH91794.1 hypothetical protein UAU_03096 [Enterococcus pallens ATCC BAA-351]EOU25222.1 hypothetical protein I588_01210 [Enterococcus pallens ATCC BAA-351]OJG79979.1 hypothetical protein RV10_GL005049 [Enterococcus pallens]
MEKGKNLLRWGIMLVASLFLFSACGAGTYDASGYVKSMLDAQTRGEYDQYLELTESTKEDAEDLYNKAIEMQMDAIDADALSDELSEKYEELFKKIYKQTKYTVGEAKEGDDDSFTVPVEVETLQLFEGLKEDLADFQKELTTEVMAQMAEDGTAPDEQELTEKAFQRMYDFLNEKVENPTYGKKSTVEVKVAKNSDDFYEADQSDMEEIEKKLIDTDVAGVQ